MDHLRTHTLLLVSLAAACLLGSAASHAQTVAGVIKKQEGTVEIVRDGKTLPASVGTTVMAGDLLKTTKDSSVALMLKDETRMSLGANSQVALDKFNFDSSTYKGNLFVNVLKGTFAMVSGLVVKNNPDSTQIKTPTSTAGIRGTSFVVEVP